MVGLRFTPSSLLIELSNNCVATIATDANCQYIVTFNKALPHAGTSSITANYNDGSRAQTATATVSYNGANPVAGLTISGGVITPILTLLLIPIHHQNQRWLH